MKKQKDSNKKNPIRSKAELEKYMKEHRSQDMLTVKDLIKFLKKQNPDACILGFEQNSKAWIEQSKNLKNRVCTVRDQKEKEKDWLQQWYKHDTKKVRDKKVKADLDEIFRYAEDDDICITF